MTRAAITNVTAGMLSNKILGRADLARYVNGALLIQNLHIDPTGEWAAREAMVFCALRKFNDRKSIPVDFTFSETQSYVLEVGHLYMRVLMNGGLVQAAGGAIYELALPFTEADLAELWWTESADVLYFCHERYEPRQLIRHDHNNWELKLFELIDGPYQKENTDTTKSLTASGNAGNVTVTAAGFSPFVGKLGMSIRWNQGNGSWSWLKITRVIDAATVNADVRGAALAGLTVTSFRLGIYHDAAWPTTARLIDGRMLMGGAADGLDNTAGSANSDYPNMSPASANDSDAFNWTLASEQVNRINAYASTGELIILTAGSLWRMSGQTDRDAITPKSVSAKKLSGRGSKRTRPAEVTDAIVWIDRSARKLLRLQFNPDGLQGYAVNDLTALADNIAGRIPELTGFVSICWLETPKPTIVAVRKDGLVAVLTYMPEEKVNAWALYQTFPGDEIEAARTIPNTDGVDGLYFYVKRIINGSVVRTVERLLWDDLLRAPPQQKRLDCCLTYDAPPAASLTLSALDGNVIATASDNVFDAAKHVGQEIREIIADSIDDDGEPVWRWCVGRIVAVDSPAQARLKVLAPFKELAHAAGSWRITVSEVSGLEVYEGATVSAQLDGMPAHDLVVQGGKLKLPQRASIVHVGRRYSARALTLPIDVGSPPGVNQGRKSRIDRVMIRVRESIGGRIGAWKKDMPTKWVRLGLRGWNWANGKPPMPKSEDHTVITTGQWTTRPQIILEQNEPLPFNVQVVAPNIYAPWQER